MSKSRHNRLAKKPMLTEIGSNSSLSNALLPSSNRDARSSDRDDGRHDRMERYTAPQASWRHSSGELDSDPAMNPMYETAPGAGPVHTEPSRVDASKGPSVKPGAANSVVRAVKGKTVLNFEHPFKQESFKKRGQMVGPADGVSRVECNCFFCAGEELEAEAFCDGLRRGHVL